MRSRRVLLVDDDADFCALLAQGLTSRGHEIAIAGDAATALSAAGTAKPDVVLVDIVLPDKNGYHLARELRGIAPRALIMGVTAYPVTPTQEQLDSGIACMFLKPVQYDDVARLIEGWVPPS